MTRVSTRSRFSGLTLMTTSGVRTSYNGNNSYNSYNRRSSEVNRPIDFGMKPSAQKSRGAESFGVEKIPAGARVKHVLFGEGTVMSAKDMGGDVLYEVKFDNGQTKRLMQTFAKLERI